MFSRAIFDHSLAEADGSDRRDIFRLGQRYQIDGGALSGRFWAATDHFSFLHPLIDQSGRAFVWNKITNKHTKIDPSANAKDYGDARWTICNFHCMKDIYQSVNEFRGWISVRTLKSLRACFVDIDNPAITLDEVLLVIAKNGFPTPSFTVSTGRGIHLYWLLIPTPAQALPVWQQVENKLVASLKNIGADQAVKDAARVLRLVGSVNSKNGFKVVGQVLTGRRFTMHELADAVLGVRTKKINNDQVRDINTKRAERAMRPVFAAKSIKSWWYQVYVDCCTIAHHHNYAIPHGSRDKFLFVAAVALSWYVSPDALLNEVLSLSSRSTDLEQDKVTTNMGAVIKRAQMSAAGETIKFGETEVDARYFFKRETIYAWLKDIIHPDMKLRAIVSEAQRKANKKESNKEISQQRNLKRRAEGRPTRDEYLSSARNKRVVAQKMSLDGMAVRFIAAELNVANKTVYRWLKKAA